MTAIQAPNKNFSHLQTKFDVLENRAGVSQGPRYVDRFSNQAFPPPYAPVTHPTVESEYARYLSLEKVLIDLSSDYKSQ